MGVRSTMIACLACASCAHAPLTPTAPVDVVPAPCEAPSANLDLGGAWLIGVGADAAEPPIPEVVITTDCVHHPAAWVLEQRGDEIEAWSFEATMEQGIARAEPVRRMEPERGRVCGLDVAIGDRYQLRYDTTSGHLRGTRDGRPFWAVRQRVIGPGPCPGIP